MSECSKMAHITIDSNNRHSKLYKTVEFGECRPIIYGFVDDFYRLYHTRNFQALMPWYRKLPFLFKIVKMNEHYCAFLLEQSSNSCIDHFCMRVIPILCPFQAYKGAGGATKTKQLTKFGL